MLAKVFPFRVPQIILAGVGAVEQTLLDQVKAFSPKKVLLLSDKALLGAGLVDTVKSYMPQSGIAVDIYTEVEPEPSIENLELATRIVKEGNYDLLVGLGGGSVIDTTKLAAVLPYHEGPVRDYIAMNTFKRAGLPTIMLPTTSGTGAEVTVNAVFKDLAAKLKKVAVSPYLMPTVAIIDPVVTLSVPPAVTAATGMDALTHALEAYVAIKATPHSDLYAEDAIRRIGQYLRTAVTNGSNMEARYQMSLGSLFGGIANAAASVGAVHALSYPLGGEFHLSHGVSNALMLPHVMGFNILGNVPKFARIAELLGENTAGLSQRAAADKAVEAVTQLAKDINIPLSMSEFNIPEDVLPGWAEMVIQTQSRLLNNNPRRLTEKDVLNIYKKAL